MIGKGLLSGLLLMVFWCSVESQPTITLEKMPGTVNSACEELKPVLTSGGDSLFFIRSYCPQNVGGEHAGEDIWLSIYKEGSGWSVATNDFGYRNKPDPDILTGLDHQTGFVQILEYGIHGNDVAIIKSLSLSGNHGKITVPLIEVPIGDDFHDVCLNREKNVLLISKHSLNSIGMEDLYVSLKSDDGEWSPPVSLGPVINTRGFEISPFLNQEGDTLYFASDGHPGSGDADLFYSIRLGSGWDTWSEPVNMGTPFNSRGFDAGLTRGPDGDFFFVSNRDGGYADIFRARKKNDAELWAEHHLNSETGIAASSVTEKVLHKNREKNEPGLILYFDHDEHKPGDEAMHKLETFVVSLKKHDYTVLRIAGYTDETGSDGYNLKLSEKRARFVYRFLMAAGIEKDRLYMEGLGIYDPPGQKEIPESAKRRVEITGIPQ